MTGDLGLGAIVEKILQGNAEVRLVAIDGPGGSGKTTFAAQLALAANDAPILHTDDFASAADPINWWPRLLEQVVLPMSDGRPSRTNATTGHRLDG